MLPLLEICEEELFSDWDASVWGESSSLPYRSSLNHAIFHEVLSMDYFMETEVEGDKKNRNKGVALA